MKIKRSVCFGAEVLRHWSRTSDTRTITAYRRNTGFDHDRELDTKLRQEFALELPRDMTPPVSRSSPPHLGRKSAIDASHTLSDRASTFVSIVNICVVVALNKWVAADASHAYTCIYC